MKGSSCSYVRIGEDLVPWNADFRLILVTNDPSAIVDIELRTRCLLVDFTNSDASVAEIFCETLFKKENFRDFQELSWATDRIVSSGYFSSRIVVN